MNNDRFVERFCKGETRYARYGNLKVQGNVLYTYAEPLALRCEMDGGTVVLINSYAAGFSVTSRRHANLVRLNARRYIELPRDVFDDIRMRDGEQAKEIILLNLENVLISQWDSAWIPSTVVLWAHTLKELGNPDNEVTEQAVVGALAYMSNLQKVQESYGLAKQELTKVKGRGFVNCDHSMRLVSDLQRWIRSAVATLEIFRDRADRKKENRVLFRACNKVLRKALRLQRDVGKLYEEWVLGTVKERSRLARRQARAVREGCIAAIGYQGSVDIGAMFGPNIQVNPCDRILTRLVWGEMETKRLKDVPAATALIARLDERHYSDSITVNMTNAMDETGIEAPSVPRWLFVALHKSLRENLQAFQEGSVVAQTRRDRNNRWALLDDVMVQVAPWRLQGTWDHHIVAVPRKWAEDPLKKLGVKWR